MDLKPSEILARARESARRLREIDELRALMLEHLGPQGHQLVSYRGGTLLDPMRKLINLIDASEALDVEAQACMADVEDAAAIVAGVRNTFPDDGRMVASVLDLHISGQEADSIADSVGTDTGTVRAILTDGMQVLDSLGLARLRAAGVAMP